MGTALDYQHLLKKIPVGRKSVINNNKAFTIENKFYTRCNIYINAKQERESNLL